MLTPNPATFSASIAGIMTMGGERLAQVEKRLPVLSRLFAAQSSLSRSGTIVRKRRGNAQVNCVRWRDHLADGRVVNRSICLGNDALVATEVRNILNQWQAEFHPERSPNPIRASNWKQAMEFSR